MTSQPSGRVTDQVADEVKAGEVGTESRINEALEKRLKDGYVLVDAVGTESHVHLMFQRFEDS